MGHGLTTLGIAALLAATVPAHAVLIDRGGGLLYDDVLNVTWLQDANYAKTSSYDADGRLSWDNANAWAADLVFYDSVRQVTYSDWRLATITPGTEPYHYSWWYGAVEFPIPQAHSELSYMYYENLGLNGYHSCWGCWQPDFGVYGNSTTGGQNDVGLVRNLQSGEYWLGAMAEKSPSYSWTFVTDSGEHSVRYRYENYFVWAVRDGDVFAVPEPGTFALLGLGLAGLGLSRRRKTV